MGRLRGIGDTYDTLRVAAVHRISDGALVFAVIDYGDGFGEQDALGYVRETPGTTFKVYAFPVEALKAWPALVRTEQAEGATL